MIADFLASWDLFHATYLAGWIIAALLGMTGVWVVAREQIFLGAAVGQASSLGVAVGLWLGSAGGMGSVHHHGLSDAWLSVLAVAAAIAAALVTGLAGRLFARRDSREAVTGWVFLLGMSGAILILAHSPHGADQIHRLMASTLIGATLGDVAVLAALLAATAAMLTATHRPLTLLALDEDMAAAVGLRVPLWNAAACLWLGLSIGLSMRVSGLLYTFGCLVLPALIARNLCRRTAAVFLAAPAVALAAAAVSFVLANHYDLPPAQVTVALLASMLPLAWMARWLR
jgi:zinc transport system permease protein